MTSQSGGGGVPSGAAGGVLGGTFPSPTFASNGTTPILGYVQAQAGADVTMTNANQWYTLVSVVITVGVWLILGQGSVNSGATGASQIGLRLYDGTSSLCSGQSSVVSNSLENSTLSFVYVAGGTVTLSLQAIANAAGAVAPRAMPTNGVGNNALSLAALRIA